MSAVKVRPMVNRLPAALPSAEGASFVRNCQLVDLAFGEILCEPGRPSRHAYFPVSGFISLATPLQGRVQALGQAWRTGTALLQRELRRSPGLRELLNRCLSVRMRQLALAAACNRYHVVAGRLARWLLMTADRAHADNLAITHDFTARMLGVRRAGVPRAASALRRRRLIGYSRGNIAIIDRAGLEAASCSCYQVTRRIQQRITRPRCARGARS